VERVADRIGILVDGVLRVDCPTDHFKESVRRVLLEFDQPPPPVSDCPGLVSSRPLGNRLELVIAGYDDRHRQWIEQLSPRAVEVIELNLEDAFIEYTRGSRGGLTLFAEEVSHV
jgi:ABC-2 type transport system ATP-binding protein